MHGFEQRNNKPSELGQRVIEYLYITIGDEQTAPGASGAPNVTYLTQQWLREVPGHCRHNIDVT